jgi:hypothetical protein
MVKNLTIGPLYPQRNFSTTELNFSPVQLGWSWAENGLRRLNNGFGIAMAGLICGVQATTWKSGFKQQFLGTSFFVAPGVAVTAWHVLEDFMHVHETANGLIKGTMEAEFQVISLMNDDELLVWPVGGWSMGKVNGEGNDFTVMTCHLSGDQPSSKVHHYAELDVRPPVIGERVCILGVKEPDHRNWKSSVANLEVYTSPGDVLQYYPSGMSTRHPGPCFAISSGATGGMSGAPVFSSSGKVLGVLSSGTEDSGNDAYSIVSCIEPLLSHGLKPTWMDTLQEDSITLSKLLHPN